MMMIPPWPGEGGGECVVSITYRPRRSAALFSSSVLAQIAALTDGLTWPTLATLYYYTLLLLYTILDWLHVSRVGPT